jgi:hypothetical protein
VPTVLSCPSCLEPCEGGTREFKQGYACPDWGARLLLTLEGGKPYVFVQCRGCGTVYDGVEGRPEVDTECVRARCGQASRQFTETERDGET